MVYYRKYRSQKISELDSENLRNILNSIFSKKSVIDSDNIPHAFLFTGPKGLGKTSTARIVAKIVNCENKSLIPSGKKDDCSIEPCNNCDQCTSITSGTNMDVLEIDAASNRGIDEIRDLREKIRLAPLIAKKKVYIIDEVHMLTTEAFNALLKTIEEPPNHAMFILCTTEPQKVPATILSRCFHIQFNLAKEAEIVHSLERVVQGEKIVIENEVLFMIASMADGGFRDAAKILEEVVLLAKGEITKEWFETAYKSGNINLYIVTLLGQMKSGNLESSLQVVTELLSEGVDMRYFITQLLTVVHSQFIRQLGITTEIKREIPDNLSLNADEEFLLIDLFSKAYQEIKFAVLPQLPLEMAILKFFMSKSEADTKTAESKSADEISEKVTVEKLRKKVGIITKNKILYGEANQNESKKIDIKEAVAPGVELLKVPANGEMTTEWVKAFWKGVIEEMKRYNHTIAGVLRSCSIKNYEKKSLIIEAKYKFHKEKLDELKTREALVKVCKILTGNDMSITVELRK